MRIYKIVVLDIYFPCFGIGVYMNRPVIIKRIAHDWYKKVVMVRVVRIYANLLNSSLEKKMKMPCHSATYSILFCIFTRLTTAILPSLKPAERSTIAMNTLYTQPPEPQMPEPKEIMAFDNYQKIPAINASGLKLMLRSPLHYWHEYLNPDKPERKPSRELDVGSALHSLVLEEEQIHVVEPEINKRTKAGKEEYAEWLDSLPDDIVILRPEDAERVDAMYDAVINHDKAIELVRPQAVKTDCLIVPQYEKTVLWDDQETGLHCKARLDCTYMTEDHGEIFVVDLKTSRDASAEQFARSIAVYQYELQAAFYRRAAWHHFATDEQKEQGQEQMDLDLEAYRFFFIAVESKPPYAVGVYELDPLALDQGDRDINKAMNLYKYCSEDNYWPGYDFDVPKDIYCHTIHLPHWKRDMTYRDSLG